MPRKPETLEVKIRRGLPDVADIMDRDDFECWLWEGHMEKGRYPTIRGEGKVARLLYTLWLGEPLEDSKVYIRNACQNLNCVNPHHQEPLGCQHSAWDDHPTKPGRLYRPHRQTPSLYHVDYDDLVSTLDLDWVLSPTTTPEEVYDALDGRVPLEYLQEQLG